MERDYWVRDLQVGQTVDFAVHVKSVQLCEMTGGKSRLDLMLADRTGSLAAVFWDATSGDCRQVQQVQFAHVAGKVKEYRNRLQLDLHKLPEDIGTPDDLSDFLVCSPIPLSELESRLSAYIGSVADPLLQALLRQVFEREEVVASRFRELPAALCRHHAFRHGLLHHTLEVTDMVAATAVCQARWGGRTVHRDLAITGALLHDIGKTEELDDADHRCSYTDGGRLLGHITQGMLIVAKAIARVNRQSSFPKPLEQMVLHLISSHHGKGEWGSPTAPLTMEAALIHMADKASAELFYFQDAADRAGEQESFVWQKSLDSGFGGSGRNVFVGDVNSLLSPPASPPALTISTHPGPATTPEDLRPESSADPARAERTPPPRVREDRALYGQARSAAGLPILRMIPRRKEDAGAPGMRELPFLGRAAAGARELDAESREGSMLVEQSALTSAPHYLIRAEGDSMSGDGIANRDVVVVRRQDRAEPHEIAVVQAPGTGPVLKRIRETSAGVQLVSSNLMYAPRLVADPSQLVVQGVVVAIARS